MPGLDQYCVSVAKLNEYVKGTYEYGGDVGADAPKTKVAKMEDKLKGTTRFCHTGWVDIFFTGNLHIIGFSLDYSEIDIWWVLN